MDAIPSRTSDFRQGVYSLLLATLAINILSLALPVMTRQIYNRVLPNPENGTLGVLMAGVCVAVALEAILRLCRAWVIGRAGAAYEHRMGCSAMERILNADLSRMDRCGIGEYLHRMNAIGRLKDFYNGYALTVLAELAFVPVFLGLIIYLAQELAVVPIVVLIAFVLVSFWKGYRLRSVLKDREKADDQRFNFLIEALEGIHTLKAFGMEKFFERRYEGLEEDSTTANYRVTQETAGAFNAGAIFSHLMVAGVVSAGAWLVLNGSLSTGSLIATLLLSGRMMQPVQKALALWARYQDFLIAREHVESLFTTPQRMKMDFSNNKRPEPQGALTLSGVSFHYTGSEKDILGDVHLNVSSGQSILLSGEHGSGKSTLLNLIAGLYSATEGQILVDGENIAAFPAEELARHVGYIRTKPVLFRGTIRENMTCFGQTQESQAREVAALLNVDKDVARLPSGFDTFLSGNGTDSISQGLRQRIAMVRVLATKPRLILFDSADRTLDREGYQQIYGLLARLKGRVSMILVTEDRNLSALADRRYRLAGGRLLEEEKRQESNIHLYAETRP